MKVAVEREVAENGLTSLAGMTGQAETLVEDNLHMAK
jgi:hypothetical protein